jgi:hypothetical protein
MPAAPSVSSPRAPRTRFAWPVAVVIALAALSWGAVSSFPMAAGPLATSDATHLVSSTSSEAPRDAVIPSARPTALALVRIAADAVLAGGSTLALAGSWAVVVLLAAVVLVRDARQRWWARLIGAPPALDVHLV